jgi:DNA-binding Lrp family transcriptional regulator
VWLRFGALKMGLDKTDEKIVNVLLENSKLSLRDIAKKVGVSVVTVMNHVRELEQTGLIKGYTTYLDYEKLGFDVQVLVFMRISKGKLFEVEKKIASHKNVFAVYDVTGEFDAIVVAKFKSRKSLDSFLKKIQTYEFVERTQTTFVLNIIKEKNILV